MTQDQWHQIAGEFPFTTAQFTVWYIEKKNIYELFAKVSIHKPPQFHELPTAIQAGIIMQFVLEQISKRGNVEAGFIEYVKFLFSTIENTFNNEAIHNG